MFFQHGHYRQPKRQPPVVSFEYSSRSTHGPRTTSSGKAASSLGQPRVHGCRGEFGRGSGADMLLHRQREISRRQGRRCKVYLDPATAGVPAVLIFCCSSSGSLEGFSSGIVPWSAVVERRFFALATRASTRREAPVQMVSWMSHRPRPSPSKKRMLRMDSKAPGPTQLLCCRPRSRKVPAFPRTRGRCDPYSSKNHGPQHPPDGVLCSTALDVLDVLSSSSYRSTRRHMAYDKAYACASWAQPSPRRSAGGPGDKA